MMGPGVCTLEFVASCRYSSNHLLKTMLGAPTRMTLALMFKLQVMAAVPFAIASSSHFWSSQGHRAPPLQRADSRYTLFRAPIISLRTLLVTTTTTVADTVLGDTVLEQDQPDRQNKLLVRELGTLMSRPMLPAEAVDQRIPQVPGPLRRKFLQQIAY